MGSNKISNSAKKVMQNAISIANNYNDVKLRPEHVMFSIVEDESSTATQILTSLGVDIIEYSNKLSDYLSTVNLTPRVDSTNSKMVPPALITKQVLNMAEVEANQLGSDETDVIHIMLGIFSINTKSKEYLEEYGITFENVKDKVIELSPTNNGAGFHDDEEDDIIKNRRTSDREKESKTPVLDNFCIDLTQAAKENRLDPIVGRKVEIRRIGQILSRKKKNNPVIIGEAGVGKTAVVEGLAQRIDSGLAPRNLLGKKIYVLDLTSVVAGTKYRGQFEERMKAILEELIANPHIIIFIDELHNLVGAGNSSGSMDASNIFKPALARGEIQLIGATTLDEFRENIEKDAALTRRFQQVLIEETTIEETHEILMNVKSRYEEHHHCVYTDEAITQCVKLAERYITDRAMPDKALDILDEAGASTNSDIVLPQEILDLKKEKDEILEEKTRLVAEQDYENAALVRKREKEVDTEISRLKKAWNEENDVKISTVDEEVVGEVISMITGIPLNKISSKETSQLTGMDSEVKTSVIGQDQAVAKVVKALKRNRLGIKDGKKPIGSFIFLGPTGVGKTYLSKMLAKLVFNDEDALVRIDMSEYQERHTVSKLIGAPPGYVGYEEGGRLTEKVRRKPYSVILFDEIEKAHPDVFKTLLQLLDEGHLTDGLGRKVNFKNTLIIMTSNIGVQEANNFGSGMGFETQASVGKNEERIHEILQKSLKKKFPPEFLNRIDDTIIFNTLSKDNIVKIIKLELKKLKTRMLDINYTVEFKQSAIEKIADVGYDVEYGARPLTRAIQDLIEDEIAETILNGETKEGDTLTFSYSKTKEKMVVKVTN